MKKVGKTVTRREIWEISRNLISHFFPCFYWENQGKSEKKGISWDFYKFLLLYSVKKKIKF